MAAWFAFAYWAASSYYKSISNKIDAIKPEDWTNQYELRLSPAEPDYGIRPSNPSGPNSWDDDRRFDHSEPLN